MGIYDIFLSMGNFSVLTVSGAYITLPCLQFSTLNATLAADLPHHPRSKLYFDL